MPSPPMPLAFLPGPAGMDGPAPGMASGWFLFGLYVLAGLLAGALCAWIAVGRGHSPAGWFFAGLAFNAAAVMVLLALPRPAGGTGVSVPSVPRRLGKVALTHAPVACPACGSPQHPASARCASCGGRLKPSASSDLSRA